MQAENSSEYCVKPRMLIVHDPTEFGAFGELFTLADSGELLTKLLFREAPDVERLHEQHRNFVRALGQHAEVRYLADVLGRSDPGLDETDLRKNPNYLYAHDAMVTLPWAPGGYILGNMRKAARQREPVLWKAVADRLALKEIVKIPPHLYLEGGDVIPFCHGGKRACLIGYGPRTSKETLFFLRETLVRDGVIDEIAGFQLAEWRLNIDGCFFPLSNRLAVAQPESIVDGVLLERDSTETIHPLDFFRRLGFEIVEATREESFLNQACNFACLGKGTFVAYAMTQGSIVFSGPRA